MFGSYEGAMVDAAAVPQIGRRTRCQHPGCGKLIELVQSKHESHPSWVHLLGARDHEPTPVEPEPEPAAPVSALPQEAFTSPEALLAALRTAAADHGYEPQDDSPALLFTARTLLQLLVPAGPCLECKYEELGEHKPCPVPNCTCCHGRRRSGGDAR